MIPAVQLCLFFLLVLGVVVMPGLDMAYVLGSALSGGRRSGLAAVAGIMAGGACHVLLTGLGIGALLQWSPALFQAVLWSGAAYVAWRLNRPPTSAMVRAARAVARTRPV